MATPVRSTPARAAAAAATTAATRSPFTPRNASMQSAGAARMASLQRSARRGGVLTVKQSAAAAAQTTALNAPHLPIAAPFDQMTIFKKVPVGDAAAASENVPPPGTPAHAGAAGKGMSMAVQVDVLEVEDWEKRIKGYLTQKAEMEKTIVAQRKDLEQLQEENRSCKEQMRVMAVDIANLRVRVETTEEAKAQVIRDKTALLAENMTVRNEHKVMRLRHDKMELELQKVKLQMNREATLRPQKTPSKDSLTKKEQLRLQHDSERVQMLTAELAEKDRELADAQRVAQLLTAELERAKAQHAKDASSTSVGASINHQTALLKAQLAEQTRLTEALRSELTDARKAAAAVSSASSTPVKPSSIPLPKTKMEAQLLAAKDAQITALREQVKVLTAQVQHEKATALSMIDECDAIVNRVERIQQEAEDSKKDLEDKLTALRNSAKEKDMSVLEERIKERAALKEQLKQKDGEIAALNKRIDELDAALQLAQRQQVVGGLHLLDESMISTFGSEDEDDEAIKAFNSAAVGRASQTRKSRRTDTAATLVPRAQAPVLSPTRTAAVQGDVHLAVAPSQAYPGGWDTLAFVAGDAILVMSKPNATHWHGRRILPDGKLSAEGRFRAALVRPKRSADA